MLSQTIGFVGAGQMAKAMAQGFVRAGLLAESKVIAADPISRAVEEFKRMLPGASIAPDNAQLATRSDVIVLAVKPQRAKAAMSEIRPAMNGQKLVISIVTGFTTQSLAEALGPCRVVRVVPNTPCLVGQSASAYCLGPGATAVDGELVRSEERRVGKG